MSSTGAVSKGWQETKSQLMRTAILEATYQSFIKHGYANTTTPLIAEMANVSRGAMTHHFKSREDVIFAGVEYLYEKRIAEYESLLIEATKNHNALSQRDLITQVVEALWKHFTAPAYYARLELILSSRTEPKLAALLERLNKDAERSAPIFFKELMPQLGKSERTAELVFDLLFFTLRGMSVSYINHHKRIRIEQTLEHLVDSCLRLISSVES